MSELWKGQRVDNQSWRKDPGPPKRRTNLPFCFPSVHLALLCTHVVFGGVCVFGQTIHWESSPISYSERIVQRNPIARLKSDLESGAKSLAGQSELDVLRSLLDHLQISEESQVLVFSKTSLQKPMIDSETPRAIYFNDVMFLGYVHGGLIEIATADPDVGAAFYTFDPKDPAGPIDRQANRCLSCHAGTRTGGLPGFFVRSVFPDRQSMPVIRAGSKRTTQRSPLDERWGGWYVTGTHGPQHHLGNYFLDGKK